MERQLQITGKGNLAVAPDIIILAFMVQAHEMDYGNTINTLNRRVEELRQALEVESIERKSLKTIDFSVSRETNWNRKTEKHEFNGFKASHNMELELPLEKDVINRLLSRLGSGQDSLDFGISFGVKDPAPHQQRLILQAIEKAKENASLIAGATGVELKEILNIDYSFREITIRSQRNDYAMYSAEMSLSDSASPDFEPDDIAVAETITITWRIG